MVVLVYRQVLVERRNLLSIHVSAGVYAKLYESRERRIRIRSEWRAVGLVTRGVRRIGEK